MTECCPLLMLFTVVIAAANCQMGADTITGPSKKPGKNEPVRFLCIAVRGVPHEEKAQFRAERIEPAIFELLAEFVEKLLKDEDVYSEIGKNRELEKETLEREIKKKKQELDDTQ